MNDKLQLLGYAGYTEYLASAAWIQKRGRIMDRDNEQCPCGSRATQIHHLTYARIGQEHDSDLRAVCDQCHDKIHQIKDNGWPLRRASMLVFNGTVPKDAPAPRKKRKPSPAKRRKRAHTRSQKKDQMWAAVRKAAAQRKHPGQQTPRAGTLKAEMQAMKARNAKRLAERDAA